MTSGLHDFTGYQVLVVGGTRGEGHAIASAFADAGASVTVTGTMMLRELYDTDLSRFDYEQVNLARQESIDHLAGVVRHLDVLVLAATCNLPYGLPPSEHAFLAEAAYHHPDLEVGFPKLTVRLTSHDAGGITERDLELARLIEERVTWRPAKDSVFTGPPEGWID